MEDKRQGASDERPKHPKESGNFFQHLCYYASSHYTGIFFYTNSYLFLMFSFKKHKSMHVCNQVGNQGNKNTN
jgi:hypothetical protein